MLFKSCFINDNETQTPLFKHYFNKLTKIKSLQKIIL